jgi:hypothetical protein
VRVGFFTKRRESKGSRAIEPAAGINDLLDLQAPPFGIGFSRKATEMVSGLTPDGRRYRSFRYSYSGGMARFDGRVLVVDLPFTLPDVFWTTGSRTRIGMEAAGRMGCMQYQSLRVCSVDDRLAKQVFEAVVGPTMELAHISHEPIDLSVDRDHLIAVDAPFDDDLPAFLAGLDRLIDGLAAAVPRRLELPASVEGFAFYGHPDWTYSAEGDRSLLRDFGLPQRPQSRVEDVLQCACEGVRMVSFRHTWLSETAAKAQMSRGMVLDNDREQEAVCAFVLDAKLPSISLNGDQLGEPVSLGNQRFAEVFDLRSTEPQQAYQLFNERVQEWLLATHPYGWTVQGNVVRFHVPTHDAILVGECEATLHGWLDRIPKELREFMGLPDMPSLARS